MPEEGIELTEKSNLMTIEEIITITRQFVDLGINSERELFDLISFVREVANEVQMEKGSARILTNLGEYQDSKHLHFHVCFGKQI